jgi:protein-tyrosine phosphatase
LTAISIRDRVPCCTWPVTDVGDPLRILTVCTHNRTRSVMMASLLGSMLSERLGDDAAAVRSAGFGPSDFAAIPDAIDAMRRRGLDVSGHRSRRIDAGIVGAADLILTAERDHVIRIASIEPAGFRRSFTLPEFTALASGSPFVDGDDVAAWVRSMTASRTALAYLRTPIEEIDDPTGSPARVFESAVVALESHCSLVATLLARALGR